MRKVPVALVRHNCSYTKAGVFSENGSQQTMLWSIQLKTICVYLTNLQTSISIVSQLTLMAHKLTLKTSLLAKYTWLGGGGGGASLNPSPHDFQYALSSFGFKFGLIVN